MKKHVCIGRCRTTRASLRACLTPSLRNLPAQPPPPPGQVLNSSVDTALAGSVRPKVVFPPIADRREEGERGSHTGGVGSPRHGGTGAGGGNAAAAAAAAAGLALRTASAVSGRSE